MLLLAASLILIAPDGDLEVADAPIGASDKEVTRAERLYEDAKYEKALNAIKKGCGNAADPVRCERIKAYIHIALGEAFAARAAFDRMLIHDPDASLGPDVSPKLQGMFADAKRAMVDVKAMRLEPLLARLEAGAPVLLEVKNPNASMVELLTVHVSAPGKRSFEPVVLSLEGEVWSGSWVLTDPPGGGPARYYLKVDLAGEVPVAVGSEGTPLDLEAPGSETTEAWSPYEEEQPAVEEGDLPTWVPIAIGGGAAVVVGAVVGIVLAVVLGGQEPPPGSIEINYEFFE